MFKQFLILIHAFLSPKEISLPKIVLPYNLKRPVIEREFNWSYLESDLIHRERYEITLLNELVNL